MTVYPNNLNEDELLDSTSTETYVLDILDESDAETEPESDAETECCCNHRIIEDYIDIDPDRSVKIFYCDTCYITVNPYNDKSTAYTDEPPITLGEPVEFIPLVDN
jgi:hypothetical protein